MKRSLNFGGLTVDLDSKKKMQENCFVEFMLDTMWSSSSSSFQYTVAISCSCLFFYFFVKDIDDSNASFIFLCNSIIFPVWPTDVKTNCPTIWVIAIYFVLMLTKIHLWKKKTKSSSFIVSNLLQLKRKKKHFERLERKNYRNYKQFHRENCSHWDL